MANGFTNFWQTGFSGTVGTLTLTALTSTRAVGTFAFDAAAFSLFGSTNISYVTAGTFDVAF